jgi:transcriptional regulator with XRE-family HTH domain
MSHPAKSQSRSRNLDPVAKWFRAVRSLEGLDQEGLARYLGKSRSAVAMYESGKRIVPPEDIAAILTAFPDAPPFPLKQEVAPAGKLPLETIQHRIKYAGIVPCSSSWGEPLASEEEREIDGVFAGRNRFLCQVVGDSCWPALRQGDLTVWELDQAPTEGVIVLAQRAEDGACTVKELEYDRAQRRYLLKPVNPDHASPPDGEGWGVTARLVGVIRQSDGPRKTWYWEPGLRPKHLIES